MQYLVNTFFFPQPSFSKKEERLEEKEKRLKLNVSSN